MTALTILDNSREENSREQANTIGLIGDIGSRDITRIIREMESVGIIIMK